MRSQPVRGWEWLLVALLAAGAAILRWLEIADQGMWLDEAFSVWMARQPAGELLGTIAAIDQHPPLYYLLLKGWMRGAGDGEAAVRGLSLLLGAATVPPIYLFARRLLGVAPAVAAALLLVVSPFHVRFAQEARMYTLLTFNATAALVGLAYLLTGDRRLRWWALYVIFSALALYSHNTAVLFMAAVNGAVAAVALLERRGRAAALTVPGWRHWLLGQSAVFLLWAPWLPSFLRQARAVDAEFWIQPPTGGAIAGTIGTFLGVHAPHASVWILGAALVALLLALVALRRRPALLALLGILVVAPFAGELLVSLRRPIFYDRTLLWTTIPLFVLLAAGLSCSWRAGAASTVAVGVLAVGNVLSLQAYYEGFTKEQWREAAAHVAERARTGDLLLFNATWVQIPFDYYFSRYGLQVEERGVPVDLFDAGVLEPKMTEDSVPDLQRALSQAECVWLIYSHDWYTDPEKIVPRTLEHMLIAKDETPFAGLQVRLYERHAGSQCGEVAPGG